MPVKNNREYRSTLEFRTLERTEENQDYIVEGYASNFERYLLFEDTDYKYFEQIDSKAFDDTDMSDVIMQFDHCGMVYARTSNNTLSVEVDEKGLKVRADLSSTNATRELYDQIRTGLITKMSFAFTVEEDEVKEESRDNFVRTIIRIKKLYDVSAVSLPANPTTSIGIEPRSIFNGAIEKSLTERLEEARKEKAKRVLALKLRLEK